MKGPMMPDEFIRFLARGGASGKPYSFVNLLFRLALWGFAIYGAHQFCLNHLLVDPLSEIRRIVTPSARKVSRKNQLFWF
jgi:hypothetical protein